MEEAPDWFIVWVFTISLLDEELIEKASSIGVYLTFSSYSSFTKYILSLIDLSTLDDFFEIMMQIHKNSRLKVESREYLLELANEYDLI